MSWASISSVTAARRASETPATRSGDRADRKRARRDCASVLSGNRNFEARVHQSIKANFLMSPPLVVAFAIAGRIDLDLSTIRSVLATMEEIYLRDIWPQMEEINALMSAAFDP
jgi:aconitase A